MIVGVSTIVFIYLLVFGYFVLSPDGSENPEAASGLASGVLPETFFALAVLASGSAAGYFAGSRTALLGFLCGVTAAATEQGIVYLNYPPVIPAESAGYLVIGATFGLVGGWLGGREAERHASSERTLFRAMERIADATTADAVAEATGASLGEKRLAGVGIWKSLSAERGDLADPDGEWCAGDKGGFAAARLVEVAVPMLPGAYIRARTVLPETLSEEGRQEWERQGVRSAFVAPLVSLGGESFGLLFVGFRGRRWLTGRTRRLVSSAAVGAWMALEKLAALEKQREQDKKLGIMEERERLSREVHDSLIQYLGSIAGELDAAEMAAEAGAGEMVWRHVGRAREGARRASSEARRLVRAMRPEVLDGSSLPEALATLARRLSEESRMEATSEVVGEVRPLSLESEHTLTRVA